MSAFACGWCAMYALWSGADYLRARKISDAIGFWFGLLLALVTGTAWLAA